MRALSPVPVSDTPLKVPGHVSGSFEKIGEKGGSAGEERRGESSFVSGIKTPPQMRHRVTWTWTWRRDGQRDSGTCRWCDLLKCEKQPVTGAPQPLQTIPKWFRIQPEKSPKTKHVFEVLAKAETRSSGLLFNLNHKEIFSLSSNSNKFDLFLYYTCYVFPREDQKVIMVNTVQAPV
ncbi:hypothetical protein JOB18_043273 [Solea senegalensis]|uniref:Uncharacterized protein n=1 Tax=Solea senegalensis TaxID=28829 RepID=A0AAV6QIN6_SOLSE|nr:hypothetical protein JOB18_043273 [Solea senegalensis]